MQKVEVKTSVPQSYNVIYCYIGNSHRQSLAKFNIFPVGSNWNTGINVKSLHFSLIVYEIYLPSKCFDFTPVLPCPTCFS